MAREPDLPKFENPPVEEVVFDVAFKKLSDFKVPFVGLLWDRYREEYPRCEDQIQLIPRSPNPDYELLATPRVWFIHADDSRVIQVQNGRFIFNWRKREGRYPNFDVVFPEFLKRFREFNLFLDDHSLQNTVPERLELTYINHITKGDGWETLEDIPGVFPDLNWRSSDSRFLPPPKHLSWRSVFQLPDGRGLLTASIGSGRRIQADAPILTLEINAGCDVANINESEITDWFVFFHKWIVLSFQDLTSPDMHHKVWRKFDD